MKPLLLTLTLIATLGICNAQNTGNLKTHYSDTSFFKTDTTINDVNIDGKLFQLSILRDKFNEHLVRFSDNDDNELSFAESPITIVITNASNGQLAYVKKFDSEPGDYPYLTYSFYKGQSQQLSKNGKLYLTLNKGYGGSGSQNTNYQIGLKGGKIIFTQLFKSSGELSYIVYNKNDQEIIVLDGIWNMNEQEAHFANHRYKITKYTFAGNRFEKKEIGQTKFKYSSLDEDKPIATILADINKKEPSLLKGITLTDFR